MEAAPTGQNPQQTQSNLPDRRLARKVGADYNKLVQAMRRLERNPNPKLLPAELMQHYSKYVGASINAAQIAARSGGARYFGESLREDPPMMLVLKRRGIRLFPDGKRVALYHNDKLNLSFSVPYAGGKLEQDAVGVYEENDIMESLEQVAAYAQQETPKTSAKHMKFADGSKLKVSHGAAKAIHMVHGALNDENKKKFAEMLKDPKGFEKAAHFALSKVTFKIGDK